MSLIDGVGDEVVHFLGVLVMVTVGMVAWWSTNARQDRYRAVVLMRSRNHHPVTVSLRTRTTGGSANLQTTQAASTDALDAPSPPSIVQGSRNDSVPVPFQEMDSIVDAEVAMIDHHRLHFYRRVDPPTQISSSESTGDESEPHDLSEPASANQIEEMDNIVNAMEADGGDRPFTNTESMNKLTTNVTDSTLSESQVNNEESKILIKLKYLNDTLKEVEGNLDEQLKDFKCRHFSTELSSQRRVRLIFRGRVLDEHRTLRALGLHHQAIVHCLVHPIRSNQRPTSEEPSLNAAQPNVAREGAQPERTWDLENVLMTLVSVALTVVWFFRCEYSNMFTASASVALFGLTVFYSVAIFGLYLSDTFHFERRPQQPVPNN